MAYTTRDRTDAVKLAHKIGVQEAAQKLDIPAPTLYRWCGSASILKAAGLLDMTPAATKDYPDTPDGLLIWLEDTAREQQKVVAKIRRLMDTSSAEPPKQHSRNWVDAILRDIS